MSGGGTLALTSADLPWSRVRLEGADADVDLVELHRDPLTRARSLLVRFPPGWRRPGPGFYACAEEVLVIEGAVSVSGTTVSAGEYAFFPPFLTRTASLSPSGCLALAWFSAAPRWSMGTAGATDAVVHTSVAQLRRSAGNEVQGSAHLVEQADGVADAPAEVVSTTSWRWCFRDEGERIPSLAPPLLVRRWA